MDALEGVYAVLDSSRSVDLPALLDAVLRAGVRLVQYRNKSGVDRKVLSQLRLRTEEAGAMLIVNDDLEAACEADGLHIGQEDLMMLADCDVRRRLGGRVLGISCATSAEALEAERVGADYLGVGPYNAALSKHDAGAPIGEEGVRAVVRATRLPVAAIGGIGHADLESVARSGARMVAVISAIAKPPAGDAEAAARGLIVEWNRVRRSFGTM